MNTFLRPDLAGMAFAIGINRVVEAAEDILRRGDACELGVDLAVWLINDAMNTKVGVGGCGCGYSCAWARVYVCALAHCTHMSRCKCISPRAADIAHACACACPYDCVLQGLLL